MCRPSVIILVINKSDSRCAVVGFCYHLYDYRPNWTPLSPITITNHYTAVAIFFSFLSFYNGHALWSHSVAGHQAKFLESRDIRSWRNDSVFLPVTAAIFSDEEGKASMHYLFKTASKLELVSVKTVRSYSIRYHGLRLKRIWNPWSLQQNFEIAKYKVTVGINAFKARMTCPSGRTFETDSISASRNFSILKTVVKKLISEN